MKAISRVYSSLLSRAKTAEHRPLRPLRLALAVCVAVAGFGPSCWAGAAEGRRTVEAATAALESGRRTVEQVLTDPSLMALHADPRFRDLIRAHAAAGRLALVSKDEEGEPLILSGTIRDPDGAPAPGALLYVFQTDHTGRYTAERAMDEPHSRIFGYLRSGPDGRYEVRTIRPGGYPGTVQVDGVERRIPQHIHVVVSAGGYRERSAQIYFADDPRVGQGWVAGSAARHGFPIVTVTRGDDGIQRCEADLALTRE